MSPLPTDVNGRQLYDIGFIDRGVHAADHKRWRVHMGWRVVATYQDGSQSSQGISAYTWTLWGANRLAARARAMPENAEYIAREKGPSLYFDHIGPGESVEFSIEEIQ